MTLAQVQAAVAVVVALGLTWAALVMAVALALPQQAGKAERMLDSASKRCFGVGLLMAGVTILSLGLVNAPSGPLKLLGILMLLFLGAIVTIGSAGIAQLLGTRISEMSGARTSFGALCRGSLVFSAGAFFPYVGWFIFAPLAALFALGSGIMAVWPARRRRVAPAQPFAAPAESQLSA